MCVCWHNISGFARNNPWQLCVGPAAAGHQIQDFEALKASLKATTVCPSQ